MLQAIEWVGMGTGIIGSCLLASNTSVSPWGYVFFFISAICWVSVGALRRSKPMLLLNGFYLLVNLFGIVRWFNLV